jgi:hypothetical protein
MASLIEFVDEKPWRIALVLSLHTAIVTAVMIGGLPH